ncbi:MAG TPA: protein kinase [Fimbriiglobus sp.]|nr:protein kinase [Fimbriiglobus sp.]
MRPHRSNSRSSVRPAPSLVFVPEAGAVPLPGYKLVRLRGVGGFASVWEAKSEVGDTVALKFMSSSNAGTTARELRSLQAIQTLDHPNLLRIRQVWSLPGCIVIAMDLADASLLDLLELYIEEFERQIEPEKICNFLLQVAQALDFLNARRHRFEGRLVGLQHGDIKPNNVLLVGDSARLADYGLATPTSGPVTPCHRQGTAEYCPPEVFQGNLTEWSDQFSFAVTYHVLRTGTFPYPPPPPKDQLKNYHRPEPDLSMISAPERPILARALSPIPQNRYPNCLELMTALLAALDLRVERTAEGLQKVRRNAGEAGEVSKSRQYKLHFNGR